MVARKVDVILEKIVLLLHGISPEDITLILEELKKKFLSKEEKIPSIAETIFIAKDSRGNEDVSDLACGMKFCPFHKWANLSGLRGPIDSICDLPGDGGNILQMVLHDPWDEKWSFKQGDTLRIRRLSKCLKIRPLESEEEQQDD